MELLKIKGQTKLFQANGNKKKAEWQQILGKLKFQIKGMIHKRGNKHKPLNVR